MSRPTKITKRCECPAQPCDHKGGRVWTGRWLIQWRDPVTGKRMSETFDLEKHAKVKLAKMEAGAADLAEKMRAGLVVADDLRTLTQVATDWLKTRPAGRLREECTGLMDRHILPFLGKHKLSTITRQEVEKLIRHLEAKPTARVGERNEGGKRTLSKRTIRHCLNVLGKLLRDYDRPVRIEYKVPKSGYSWIRTSEDVARYLEQCEASAPWFGVFAAIGAYTGMRKGEIAGLRRDAIDFDRELIEVRCSYDKSTKTGEVRYVPLPPELAKRLKPWLLAHPGPLVVTREEGQPVTEDYDLASRARAAAKRAGIPSVNFYQGSRHTAASLLAEENSGPVVGQILGHASPLTTKRYIHLHKASIVRSPSVQLSFARPAGEVVDLPVNRLQMQTADSKGR